MRPLRAASISLVLALAAACESPTGISDGIVSVTHESGSVVIRNATGVPLGYLIVEGHMSGLIDWVPCTGLACPTIGAHGSVTRTDSSIYGFTPSAQQLVLWWWSAQPDSSVRIVSEQVHRLVVPL